MALRTHRRQARDCDRLPPERLSPFLDMEGPAWPTRASVGSERRTRADPSDEPREPDLGRPQDSRPAAQTRDEHRRAQRAHVPGSAIKEVRSAPRSPWQRAYVERVIGTIRRECLNHLIVFNEASLYRHVKSFVTYYHESRTHLSLGKDSPQSRAVQPPELGRIV